MNNNLAKQVSEAKADKKAPDLMKELKAENIALKSTIISISSIVAAWAYLGKSDIDETMRTIKEMVDVVD